LRGNVIASASTDSQCLSRFSRTSNRYTVSDSWSSWSSQIAP
jgi:hypothetical protein